MIPTLIHKEEENGHPVSEARKKLTMGQRMADYMSALIGSWGFILFFIFILLSWIMVNMVAYKLRWDPYPFILLNLMLSSLAAIQAPIIMMSQNRQAERDRLTSKYDYAVNRKAEREIQNMQKDLEEIKKMLGELKK